MYLYICQQIEFKMNKYRITNPNNKEVRECKSRTTGGIASAFYKQIPTEIMNFVVDKLPNEYIEIMNKFDEQYDRK